VAVLSLLTDHTAMGNEKPIFFIGGEEENGGVVVITSFRGE